MRQILVCLFFFATFPAAAGVSNDGLWHDVAETAAPGDRQLSPRAYRVVSLNVDAFRDLAQNAPLELTRDAERLSPVMTLPMPDGTYARFRIQESVILDPQLAARLVSVKTYRGQGVDDPAATARLDFTPLGFHGFVRSPRGSVYIDPYARGNSRYYMSYWRRDYLRGGEVAPFHCDYAKLKQTTARKKTSTVSTENQPSVLAASGATLRTYRLALAATGEYTQFYGGTVELAQAGMVTTMNRVNGIFEQDVAVRMVMVNNTSIVFTDPDEDPYWNDDGDLEANQVTIDAVIGAANYDIGHLFGTGGGGIAYTQSVCDPGFKAQGLTGSSGPIGDAFDVDYVAHEMGHQFGAEHTFNGTTENCGGGNREAISAYEPNSGSTIMSYAGICGAEDLQLHSDPYFHGRSFDEIVSFTTGFGACAVETSTGNHAPTVNAGPAFFIPRSTPFYLTGSATDPDNHPLTFTWEQFNLGTASPPSTDNGNRPLFRSFSPVTSPVRTFPKLSDLLANTTTIGEVMPTTTRTMTFRLTARDNQPGGGGVNYASTTVSVASLSGPFLVTAPNTAVTWTGNTTEPVTWNVASTTAAPVSCANVKILLSTDGGVTFPTTLLASTPNDGTQSITVPNVSTTTARIRVECTTSPFFDLSNADFTISPAILVTATATSTTTVDVTWTAAAGALSYEIHRRPPGGSYALVGTTASLSFTDTTATPNTAYLYAVKPVGSSLSAPDLASTFIFTDAILTTIKATHFTELRSAIASLRLLASLPPYPFADPTLTPGTTHIKATHMTDLRTALDEARVALGFAAGTYTDGVLTVIKGVQVMEVRSGVQ